MIRRVFTASVLLVAIAVMGAPASAQPPVESHHMISVGLGGGVSVPVSDAKDVFDNGFNGQGFVRLNLGALPITPRFDFTFNKFDIKSSSASSGIPSGLSYTGGTNTTLAGAANLQIPLMHGPVSPYLIAGLGAYNVKTELDNTSAVYAPGGNPNTSNSETHFGINGGAGLIVKLGIVSLYAEGRVDNVYTDQGLIDSKSIQTVPVTFGLVY
jgi:opacity protein-like surface antigen